MAKQWHNKTTQEAMTELNVTSTGLTTEDAQKRLTQYGPNELKKEKGKSPLKLLLGQFTNILMIILLIAIGLSIAVGEATDAIIILAIVIASAVLGFSQEYRSEKAVEALKKMTAPTASVLRDSKEFKIPASQLVPGDIILLYTGDKIPADAKLLEAFMMKTDEASLTGESTPVNKLTLPLPEETLLNDRRNMVFTGTVVVYGRGKALVTSTGMKTEFGKIAEMVQAAPQEKTPLEKRMGSVGKWIGILAIIVALSVGVVGVVVEKRNLIDMILWAISLAVAAVPEALPAIITGALAIGMYRMAKVNTIVKRLPAVETLGSTSVICSDKTGTMTKGEMTVQHIYVNDQAIKVTGIGYAPQGEFQFEDKAVTPDENLITLLKIAVLCNDSNLEKDSKTGKWTVKGDPTEGSLVVAAEKAGFKKEFLENQTPRVSEVPFSSERKRMTTIHMFEGKGPRHRGARHVPEGGPREQAGVGGDHPGLPGRLPAAEAPRDRAGAPRGVGPRRRFDERARAGDRHRQPRRGGAGGLSRQRGLGLAAGGAGGAADGDVRRRARGQLVAAQPVHREEPRLFLRLAGRAGPGQPRQPADPRQPRQVRGVRAALRGRRAFRQGEPRRDPEVPRGREAPPPGGGPLALDERKLPGGRGQPEVRLLRQLRDPGRDPGAADHRRGGLRLGPVHGPREGGLHPGGADLLRREVRSRGAARGGARGRGRLLHRRHHVHEGPDPGSLRGRGSRQRPEEPRGGPRHLAGRGVQEDQVPHQRERRVGRADHARERDAHDLVLAHGPARDHAGAALRPRGAAGRGGGALVHALPARRPLPDVRPARPRRRPRRQRTGRGADRAGAAAARGGSRRPLGESPRPATTTSPTSSSTTPTPVASASPSRSTASTTGCSPRAARSSPPAPAPTAARPAWAQPGKWGAGARPWPWRFSTPCWPNDADRRTSGKPGMTACRLPLPSRGVWGAKPPSSKEAGYSLAVCGFFCRWCFSTREWSSSTNRQTLVPEASAETATPSGCAPRDPSGDGVPRVTDLQPPAAAPARPPSPPAAPPASTGSSGRCSATRPRWTTARPSR